MIESPSPGIRSTRSKTGSAENPTRIEGAELEDAARMRKFELELHPDKTRLIEFGRFAARDRQQRGEGKPETFNFLGFTHLFGTTRTTGQFTVRRQTIARRLRAKLGEVKERLRRRWHEPVARTGAWLRSVVQGYGPL